MKNLRPSDFTPEDRRYDGGQYQYFIDPNDFQPYQEPGSARVFLRKIRFQINAIKTKSANKVMNLGRFVRKNETSDGVVKWYFEGEYLLSEW